MDQTHAETKCNYPNSRVPAVGLPEPGVWVEPFLVQLLFYSINMLFSALGGHATIV